MKSYVLIIPATIAILAAGCGKSSGEKQAESGLFDRILARHEFVMALSDSARQLIDSLDLALKTRGNSGADSAALAGTRERLVDGIAEMRKWMSSLRPPDTAMDHREALAALERSRTDLERIEGDLSRALASAGPLLSGSIHR
jgi:hypothetical protein